MNNAGVSLSISNNLGGVIGTVLGGFTGNPGQSFQTIPLPNARLALYALVIRSPTPPNAIVVNYTFPLSPSSVRRESTSMTNTYDVSGSATQNGVQRIADLYGQSPVNFILEGTTGWQYHATDNFAYTGIESVAALQSALQTYASYNASQQANGNSAPYIMEFYDYFFQDYWQVVPAGKQVFSQSERRPLLFEYSIQLAGIQSVAAPPTAETDVLLSGIFGASASQQAVGMTSSINALLTSYKPTVLGGGL